MDICSEIFTVTLPDVGENNKLTNKGILRMLQEIACIHSNLCGIGVNNAQETGVAWVILNWKLQVFSRPIWNTKLTINTWSSTQNAISSYRDFEVLDENNNLVAIASSKWVLFDINSCSIVKIDEDISSKYQNVDKHVFNTTILGKIKEPAGSKLILEYTVQKRDIDTNHHVNNLNYLDFAYEVLPENYDFNNVEIMYKLEAKLGDTLNLFYAKEENNHFVVIKNNDNSILHCIVKLFD